MGSRIYSEMNVLSLMLFLVFVNKYPENFTIYCIFLSLCCITTFSESYLAVASFHPFLLTQILFVSMPDSRNHMEKCLHTVGVPFPTNLMKAERETPMNK